MDTIFLDTSIFIKENFLTGTKINQFLSLSQKGYIEMITTPITIEEIKNVFQKWIKTTEKLYKDFKKNVEVKSLWNTTVGEQMLIFLKTNDLVAEFNGKLDKAFHDSGIESIGYNAIDLKDLFDKYFTNSYPFNTGDKKNEFPDAVVLKLLEKWCEDELKSCIVFSTDGDFLGYKHSQLTIRSDYENYLSDKLKEIDKIRTDLLDEIYEEQRPVWRKAIEEWVIEQCEEWDAFSAFVNDHEIHDVSNIEVKILEDEYNIIQLSNDNDEIKIDVTVKVSIKADVVADDPEYTYYDSDDKSYHYFETTTTEVDIIEYITCTFTILLISEDDNEGEFNIIEFNGGEPLDLCPDIDY